MSVMPVTLEQGKAACSDPLHLPLVDAAHAKPGGPEAQRMKRELCGVCPVFDHCLDWAMTHGEIGVWAATSPNLRGRHGAPRTLPPTPAYLHHGREGVPLQEWRRKAQAHTPKTRGAKAGKPNATVTRLAQLGVTGGQVKAWALEQGMVRTIKGRVALATVEAYASQHQRA